MSGPPARKGTALVTGAAGLVGSAAVRRFATLGFDVLGIDNDSRAAFFGPAASTAASAETLVRTVPRYRHFDMDIRDTEAIERLVREVAGDLAVVVHAAAQPSHDWAARAPIVDFSINAVATLVLLDAVRRLAPDAVFLFMSTNKVYGDAPNRLPLITTGRRFAVEPGHPFATFGVDESMSIDQAAHSLFGASKASADLMVQEYGRRFGLLTTCFRAGCITGPNHRGTVQHGFLSHLTATAARGETYRVIGHDGMQVRDNLHADDLADAFVAVLSRPRQGAVYNIGGGPLSSCSVNEALAMCETLLGREVSRLDDPSARFADHKWWISDIRRFQQDYPGWAPGRTSAEIIAELLEAG